MHNNVSFAKQSIFVMCDILEVYHYVSATHFTDTYTWEPRFCYSNPDDGHQLVVAEATKLFLAPSSRCVLTVGEEERAGNINGAQLLGRELLLGWSWGGVKVPHTLDPCVNTFLKWICLVHIVYVSSFGLQAFLFKGEKDSASQRRNLFGQFYNKTSIYRVFQNNCQK